MSLAPLIDRMLRFPSAVEGLVGGLDADDSRWRPVGGGWSVLEITNHLVDEEVEDFRERLERTLRDPTEEWPPLDPEAAIVERRYNERDLTETLSRFTAEREASVASLASTVEPDWSRTHEHASLGSLSAGDLLASWAAHDALHLRQLARRMFELAQRDTEGWSTRYAGTW